MGLACPPKCRCAKIENARVDVTPCYTHFGSIWLAVSAHWQGTKEPGVSRVLEKGEDKKLGNRMAVVVYQPWRWDVGQHVAGLAPAASLFCFGEIDFKRSSDQWAGIIWTRKTPSKKCIVPRKWVLSHGFPPETMKTEDVVGYPLAIDSVQLRRPL